MGRAQKECSACDTPQVRNSLFVVVHLSCKIQPPYFLAQLEDLHRLLAILALLFRQESGLGRTGGHWASLAHRALLSLGASQVITVPQTAGLEGGECMHAPLTGRCWGQQRLHLWSLLRAAAPQCRGHLLSPSHGWQRGQWPFPGH